MHRKNAIYLISAFIVTAIIASAENMKGDYYLARLMDTTLSVDTRLACSDTLLSFTDIDRYDVMFRKGMLYLETDRFEDAAKIFEKLEAGTPKETLNAIFMLGRCNYFLGDYENGVASAYKILKTEKPDSLKYYDTCAKLLLADIYLRLNNADMAELFLQEAAYEIPQLGLPDIDAEKYINWQYRRARASVCIAKGDYTSALEEIKQAEQWEYDSRTGISDEIFMAIIYEDAGENQIAEEYYSRLIDEPIPPYLKSVVINNYSWLLLKKGEYDKILDIYQANKDVIDNLGMYHIKCFIYNVRANAYAGKGDYKTAFTLADSAQVLSRSIYNSDKSRRITEMTVEYGDSLIDREEKLARQRERAKTIAIVTLSALLAVCAALFSLTIMKCRRHAARNKELETRIAGIDRSHQDSLRITRQEINVKDRELTAIALWVANINESIDYILKESQAKDRPKDDRLKNIRNHIKKLDIQKNAWSIFNTYFSHTHHSFFSSLYDAHTDLTNGEMRMCAFIAMNLTTKDIAQLTNRSVRTIEAIKYSLRKKMNISEPTETYLRRFLQ